MFEADGTNIKKRYEKIRVLTIIGFWDKLLNWHGKQIEGKQEPSGVHWSSIYIGICDVRSHLNRGMLPSF